MVIMILSENWVDVTTVGIPFTIPALCFVTAGYVEFVVRFSGDEGAMGIGIAVTGSLQAVF